MRLSACLSSGQSSIRYQYKPKTFLTYKKSPLDKSQTKPIGDSGPYVHRLTIAGIAQKCYIISHHRGLPMATTTTIRIEDDLKARVATAAERAGKSAHAFMLDAIAQTVEQAELDDAFHRVADERWAKVLATGKTVPWDDAKVWLEARSLGERPRKPAARKMR
jgi:predicted transcriptional regulator